MDSAQINFPSVNHSLLIVFHGSKQPQKRHLEKCVVSQKFYCDIHLGCENNTKKSKLYREHADFVNEIITSGIKSATFSHESIITALSQKL